VLREPQMPGSLGDFHISDWTLIIESLGDFRYKSRKLTSCRWIDRPRGDWNDQFSNSNTLVLSNIRTGKTLGLVAWSRKVCYSRFSPNERVTVDVEGMSIRLFLSTHGETPATLHP
jgi:hypothetical protein